MHRSSETIGAIAGALAKAQAELTNPEKSLTATLPSLSQGEGNRSFRYAPLSSGLEIVRKCLGRHEIAALQTTAMDCETGLICLTTVLAHSSGEWVSSDWPVCPIAETGAPHQMGAALTYARRYALFTLVGIAGEDDLDAPGLTAPGAGSKSSRTAFPNLQSAAGSNRTVGTDIPRTFDAGQSAKLRVSLIAELERLVSSDDATVWAYRNLTGKNKLMAADAAAVENAFAKKLSKLDLAPTGNPAADNNTADPTEPTAATQTAQALLASERRPIPQKGIRLRDKQHLKFVASHPCLVCGRAPSDAHHLRFAQPRALGRRVSDQFTVPLCRTHHRELHRRGDEAAWWQAVKIDPIPLALNLWQERQFDRTDI
ncbi:MAG: ERF family protein [Xanthobacteraceae bacterium]